MISQLVSSIEDPLAFNSVRWCFCHAYIGCLIPSFI